MVGITEKDFREFILENKRYKTTDPCYIAIIHWAIKQWTTKVGELDNLCKNLRDANYLPDSSISTDDEDEFRDRTRQARRQYVFDCIKAGKELEL